MTEIFKQIFIKFQMFCSGMDHLQFLWSHPLSHLSQLQRHDILLLYLIQPRANTYLHINGIGFGNLPTAALAKGLSKYVRYILEKVGKLESHSIRRRGLALRTNEPNI